MTLKSMVIGLGMILFSASALAASNQYSVYINQRGSTLELIRSYDYPDAGRLTGFFTAESGDCEKDLRTPLPVSGYFNGNAIAVTVNFPHCESIVAMTGNVSNDLNNLHTLWLYVKQSTDPQGKDWKANNVGADAFKRRQ